MASVTIHGRVRRLWLAKQIGYVAIAIGSDRLLRWALGLMRLDMKIGRGRWRTIGRVAVEGTLDEDGWTLHWARDE